MEILIKKPNSEIEERSLGDGGFGLLKARTRSSILLSCRLTGDFSKDAFVHGKYKNFNFVETRLLSFAENKDQKNVTVNIYNVNDELQDSIEIFGDLAIVTMLKTFSYSKNTEEAIFGNSEPELLKMSKIDVIEDSTESIDFFDFIDCLQTPLNRTSYPFSNQEEFNGFCRFMEGNAKIFRGTKDEIVVKDGVLAFKYK